MYYRVRDAAPAAARVAALLAAVAARTGLRGVLQRRADDPSTWMEVFAPVPDVAAFLQVLATCEVEAGVAEVIDGTRHRECFVPLDTAAP